MNTAYFTKFRAKEGKGGELFAFLSNVASSMGSYPGCSEYRTFKVVNDPDAICVFEVWTDAAAHDASLQNPEVREAVMKGMALIEKVERQDVLA